LRHKKWQSSSNTAKNQLNQDLSQLQKDQQSVGESYKNFKVDMNNFKALQVNDHDSLPSHTVQQSLN